LVAPNGQVMPQLGQRVEAGQLLALLKPNFSEAGAKIVEARAEFNVAKAGLEQSEAAYNRVKKLVASQAKSERELQEAELAYQTAKTRYAAAVGLLATFKQAGEATQPDAPLVLEIRAPIAGVVNAIQTGMGDMVSADQTLFTILNAEKVWLVARVPEASLSRLNNSKSAAMEIPGKPGEFASITEASGGRFVSLGMEVDTATRTVPLIYEVSNKDGALRLGQNVSLHIETAQATDAVVVAEAALVEEAGQLIAFIQLSGETFEKREVKIGIRDSGFVQILEGIKEGERVVTKGAYAIRLSSISGVIPAHGHAH
jgi:membrane fusion protein, heavy metal efflux system